jgi:hypothetical protein
MYSSWTMQNLPLDWQYIRNCDANRPTRHDHECHFQVTSRGLFEPNISRPSFGWTTLYEYPMIRLFWRSYTAIDRCYQTNIIRLTFCKLWGGGKPLPVAATLSRIHLEHYDHVGCYLFHSDKMLTILSSGLPTSSHCHLPLLFHTSTSRIDNHLLQVWADRIPTDWHRFNQIQIFFAPNKSVDTSSFTTTLPIQQWNI